MKRSKKKTGLYVKYPPCPHFIFPKKYDELFWVLPICFVMFFVKGGGWAYSIAAIVVWVIFARLQTKRLWRSYCWEKEDFTMMRDGKPVPEPPHDFHYDSINHKKDDLHYVYHLKEGRWESRQEIYEKYQKESEEKPYLKELNDVVLRKLDAVWEDQKRRGL